MGEDVDEIDDIIDSTYMEAFDDGYNHGFKKGYIARLEDEDAESNVD